MCFELGYWPSHFKISTFIIIPQSNKKSYNFCKTFKPIVLFNMLGKFIEKVISECLQFHLISNNFIYPSQLSGLKQHLSSDAGVILMYFIYTRWIKNNTISTLVFDIAQFFPALNHHLLPLIFNQADFDLKISILFHNYLVGRKTQYFWNNFSSSFFNADVGVGQGSALFPYCSYSSYS